VPLLTGSNHFSELLLRLAWTVLELKPSEALLSLCSNPGCAVFKCVGANREGRAAGINCYVKSVAINHCHRLWALPALHCMHASQVIGHDTRWQSFSRLGCLLDCPR
jgi:hypothetical protein